MLFNSIPFAIFLPVVFALYWICPDKFRWVIMLISSYWFYMSWKAEYVVLIFLTTLISYLAAIVIEKKNDPVIRRIVLIVSLVFCLGILFFFKYFDFVSASTAELLHMFSIDVSPVSLMLILPVGISFYTFQTLSYVIDVYKGDTPAEYHFGKYAAFVSFFPQLVAGPIERTGNLLPQIKAKHEFDYSLATYGLKQMAWGYFKKIAVADTVSIYVSKVYDSPSEYQGFALLLATLLFSVQIYCDFSGYSDIAIGTAKLFGVKLMTNFNSPYFSQSVKEFWSRWHISLSTWFRDYIYIPMGGNRTGKIRHAVNIMVTFLVSGLWHGANWTFVIWGGIHGLAQIIEGMFITKKNLRSKGFIGAIRCVLCFAFCAFAWIFFVSDSLSEALYVITNMFCGASHPLTYFADGFEAVGLVKGAPVYLIISLVLMAAFDLCSMRKDVIEVISSRKKVVRWIIYVVFVLWIIINVPCTDTSEFIYFQF